MKAVFFSPFANIWEHSLPESLVATSLSNFGYQVKFVRCDHILDSFCVAMSASGLTADSSYVKKKQVCTACHKRAKLMDTHFNFESEIIENYLVPEDLEFSEKLCSNLNSKSWKSIKLDGVPIGRYAAYEFVLRNKIDGKLIPEDKINQYKAQLKSSILVYLASKRYLAKEKPDVVITSNRLYSAHHSFVAAAEAQNIPNYSIQGGDHIQRRGESITLYKNGKTQFELLESNVWDRHANFPISEKEIQLVKTHLSGLFEGSSAFAYSSEFTAAQPKNLRKQLGLPEGCSVALVTMSSEDEYNAAKLADLFPDLDGKANLFENQIEWLSTIFEIANSTPEEYFVIRLHPRMFPNKRENVRAPIVDQINKLLANKPDNVVVNLPDQNISIYDLLQITTVLLNYGSTVGLEFAAYGVPVVSPASRYFFTYPENIHQVGYSISEYKTLVTTAINTGWSLENSRNAFRWMNFLFTKVALDLSENITSQPTKIRPKKPGFRLYLWRKIVYLIIQFGPLIRERLSLSKATISKEKQAIIFDVISSERNNIAESQLQFGAISAEDEETQALISFFDELAKTKWQHIQESNSLAGVVRRELSIL